MADFVVEQRLQLGEFFPCVAFHEKDGLEFLDGFGFQAFLGELRVDGLNADFVQLVDGHGDVDQSLRLSDVFGDASQHLAVVDFQCDADFQCAEHLVDDLHQLGFIQ